MSINSINIERIFAQCLFLILSLLFIIKPSIADTLPVVDRTTQVRDTIIAVVGVDSAAEVNNTHLSTIKRLDLRAKGITELKSGDFSGMTGLESLNLYKNELSSLPQNIFVGLTALTSLRLGSNTVDPLPVTVSIEKVGTDQVRVVVTEGAPTAIVLPIVVTNGMLADGITNLTIPIGSAASSAITVSIIPNTTGEITVDIGTLPSLPRNHYGYSLTKSDSLPISIVGAITTDTSEGMGTTDDNTSPVFTEGEETTRTIVENTASGMTIGDPVSATDSDEDSLTYTLGGTDADVFEIESTTGQLKTKNPLDFELETSYSITVTVSDGSLTDSITVTVMITDVLDNRPPVFSEGIITVRSILENSLINMKIGEPVIAVDPDEHELEYSLSGYSANDFEIDKETAQLNTKAPLDFEQQRFYVVVVNATDGTYSDSITTIIRVIDLDDVTTTPMTLTVSERTQQVQDAIVDAVPEIYLVEDINVSDLSLVTELNLRDTDITVLQRGDFGGLTSLESLNLYDNMIFNLPVGIFEGLTALKTLRLGNNLLNPFPLFVSMQKVRENVYQVIVPSGAPFDIEVPLIVKNGSLSDNKTSITVPQGTLKSETFMLVADVMSDAIPTVDIGDLPMIPNLHYGYILTKSTVCNRTPQVRDAIIKRITEITDCRHVTEVDLATMAELKLDDMGIEKLTALDFAGMLSLTSLSLKNNKITELPNGVFAGLYSLKELNLIGNWILVPDPDEMMSISHVVEAKNETQNMTPETDTMMVDQMMSEEMMNGETMTDKVMLPLSVSVEVVKLEDSSIRAIVPTGAPFDIVLPLSVQNGMITDEISSLIVRTGEVESSALSVSRIPETVGAVTADFTIPEMLPPLHAGYILTKVNKDPLELIERIEVRPVFTDGDSSTRTITENVEAGVNIGSVIDATDDNEDILTYTLTGEDADSFEIDSETGQLITSKPLDFEDKDSYTVIVNVSDGTYTEMITVTISVVNTNDAPLFVEGESTNRSIVENTAADNTIGTPIAALDADNDALTYSLGGTDADVFGIDESTGQLKTKDPLDFETKETYSVEITVEDPDGATDVINLTVNVSNKNEAPILTEGLSATREIAENADTGSEIGNPFNANDPDANTTLTYILSGTDADSFDLESSTGQLKTKGKFDYETKSSYKVKITVSDGSLTDTIDVDITVTDVADLDVASGTGTDSGSGTDTETDTPNAAPEFTDGTSTTRSIAENSPSGTNIGIPVSATDKNENDMLSYTLSGTDASSFALVANTGQLQTKSALNYETKAIYSVTITVSDGNMTDSIAVTINVTDIDETTQTSNSAPEFTDGTVTSRSVAENSPIGTNIGSSVSASDDDADTLGYTLSGTDAGSFKIVGSTGQLQTSVLLNYEIKSIYTVTVTVSDGNLTDSIAVTINVVDIDETPQPTNSVPEFTEGMSTSRSVAENSPIGTNIGAAVSASDDDADTLRYSLSGPDAGSFSIVSSTGQLQTSVTLDYETKSIYSVTVTVSDGNLTESIVVTINVTDVDETDDSTSNAPVFTDGESTSRTIAENSASGTDIGVPVSATDSDDDVLTYTLSGTDAASFSVVSTSGQMKTSASLNFETKSSYSVTITVSDGSLTDSINVTINVTNVNEAPVFSEGGSTTRSISPFAPIGTNVGTPVTATDVDSANLTYTLSGTDATSFSLDSNIPGQLKTEINMAESVKNSYALKITVSDGTLQAEINVTITVGTSNAVPVFTEGTSTTRSVRENVASGTNVGAPVAATDAETDDANLDYRLSGTNAIHFYIEDGTGQIKATSFINFERTSRYELTVHVLDDGTPPRSNSIQVTINVIDDTTEPKPVNLRAQEVQNAILETITSDPRDVTAEQLALIKRLNFDNSSISTLVTEDFEGLTGLEELRLEENDLESLPDDFFSEMTTLKTLDLQRNDLTALPTSLSDLTLLTYLDLNHNEITTFPTTLADLTALKTLWLHNNKLTSFPNIIKLFTELKSLNLSKNSIGSIPADAFTNLVELESLGLTGCALTSLPASVFSTLTKLDRLLLAKNSLGTLENANIFDSLTSLKYLDISENGLTSIADGIFDNLTVLEHLLLYGNELGTLSSGIFDQLSSLIDLDLSANMLNPLPDGLLLGLTSLVHFDLTYNKDDGDVHFNIELVKIEGEDKFKAIIAAGAPFDLTIAFAITNGSATDSSTSVTIDKGSAESSEVTVSRTGGTTEPVVVAIDKDNSTEEIPGPHFGYKFNYVSEGVTIFAMGESAPQQTLEIPVNTGLLPNYPSPFNPETWIPYQLSQPSEVMITIYDIYGHVVRRLEVGQQSAGYYLKRGRAVYWDGRNVAGERVANGVYFYGLHTSEGSYLRKMLILK